MEFAYRMRRARSQLKKARAASIYDRCKAVYERLRAKAQTAFGWPSGVRQAHRSGQARKLPAGFLGSPAARHLNSQVVEKLERRFDMEAAFSLCEW